MRVIISGDVLDAPGTEPWKIHELLGFACQRRHVVSFDPHAAMNRCLDTFEPRARAGYAQAIALDARAAATLPANVATVRVELTTSADWADPVAVLPLDDALAVLREPLGVLVENASNDWYFLLGIMRQSERRRIQDAKEQGWTVPLHGGGNTLKAQLQERLKIPKKKLRTFVMFDSDRLHPDELEATWTPKRPSGGRAVCDAFEWEQLAAIELRERYWRLRRRFIESYMPKAELTQASTHPGAVEAFYRMSQHQRWYFNMKKGFAGDEKRHDKDRCRDLYTTVNASDREALNEGFGPSLADHYVNAPEREFDWDAEARLEASAALSRLMRLL